MILLNMNIQVHHFMKRECSSWSEYISIHRSDQQQSWKEDYSNIDKWYYFDLADKLYMTHVSCQFICRG